MHESEFPDESWSDDDILSLVEKNTEDASSEAGYIRLAGLNILKQREIVNVERTWDVLIKLARYDRPPESQIIIPMLSSLADSRDGLFQKLLSELEKGKPDALLYNVSEVIRNLDPRKKKRSAEVLIKVLMSKDSFTHTTDEMCETLIVIGRTAGEEVVKLTRPYLKHTVPHKVMFAARILSELADEQLTNDFCEIIRNTLNGWYDAPNFREQIQRESCKLFQRIRDISSFPCLLELLEKASNPYVKVDAEEALASLIDNYPQLMEDLMKAKILYPLKLNTLVKLNTDTLSRLDIDALYKLVPLEDREKVSIQDVLNKIIIRAGKKVSAPTEEVLIKLPEEKRSLVEEGKRVDLENGYDVSLTFAGEQREYVKQVADILQKRGARVFYDEYNEADMWGKDLAEYFEDIFYRKSLYCIMFISKDYVSKVWPTHERRSAVAKQIEKFGGYILPVRFDNSEVPGFSPTIKYVDARKKTPEDIANLFMKKLKKSKK